MWVRAFLKSCMVKRESLWIADLQGNAQGEVEAYKSSRSNATKSGEFFDQEQLEKDNREQYLSDSDF